MAPAVAWLPQRPWLTAGTIAANLRHGDPTATDARLWRALERVDLAHVVLTLPAGLETELGEDGAGLSAGERARLALARVLVSDRPVVLLDEPTAHLDAATEDVLARVIGELARSRTVIVVAHRPALVELADQVIHLEPTARRTPRCPTRDHDRPETAEWRPSRRADLGAIALGALSAASGVALTATAGWLITRASTQPPVLTLMVAIVGVRAFGLARPVLRYAERLLSHEQALGRLADRRADVYAALVPLVPARLGAAGRRRGDLLTSLVDDVDALVDERVRVRVPLGRRCSCPSVPCSSLPSSRPSAALVVGAADGRRPRSWPSRSRDVQRGSRRRTSTRAPTSASCRDHADRRAAAGRLAAGRGGDRRRGGGEHGHWRRSPAAQPCAPAVARCLLLLATGAAVALMPLATTGLSAATAALLVLLPLALHETLAPVIDAVVAGARCRAATARVDGLLAQEPAVADPVDAKAWPSAYPTIEARDVGAAVPVSFTWRPANGSGSSARRARGSRRSRPS